MPFIDIAVATGETASFSLADAATQAFSLITPAWDALTSNPAGILGLGVLAASVAFAMVRKVLSLARKH